MAHVLTGWGVQPYFCPCLIALGKNHVAMGVIDGVNGLCCLSSYKPENVKKQISSFFRDNYFSTVKEDFFKTDRQKSA